MCCRIEQVHDGLWGLGGSISEPETPPASQRFMCQVRWWSCHRPWVDRPLMITSQPVRDASIVSVTRRPRAPNTGPWERNQGFFSIWLKLGAHCAIYNSPLRLLLVRLYEHNPHVTLWDLSCPICQTVRQSRCVKNGRTLENLSGVLHQPTTIRWLKWWLTKKSLGLILIMAYLEKRRLSRLS